MVACWTLALLDLISVTVYIDLWLVNRYGVHIFTPVIKIFDNKKFFKRFQKQYYRSLQRNFFCVSDKVSIHSS